MATPKNAEEFLVAQSGGSGASFTDGFDQLPFEEQEKVLKTLGNKKKKGPGSSDGDTDANDNGM